MLTNREQNYIDLVATKKAIRNTLSTLPDLENSIIFANHNYLLSDILKIRTELEKDLRFIENQIAVAKSEFTTKELQNLYQHKKG